MIELDFETRVEIKAGAIAPSSTSTKIGTIPLATADWPLQAGRSVAMEADFVGFDTNGVAFQVILKAILPGEPGEDVAVLQLSNGDNGCFVSSTTSQNATGYTVPYNPIGITNDDGDLDLYWANGNELDSGVNQDVCVRVKMRWFGS
jgi:hypothetical protein